MKDAFRIFTVFGTRPEVIKLLPVIHAGRTISDLEWRIVSTGQQRDLLPQHLTSLGVTVDHDLRAIAPSQSLVQSLATMLSGLDELVMQNKPDGIVVQGDTSSALAAALCGRFHQIPVFHVEAGLRSYDRDKPFPEESNRRLIAQVSALHFAPTARNVDCLLKEGISRESIIETGNPIVDAIGLLDRISPCSEEIARLMNALSTKKFIVMTMHRRENFGDRISEFFRVVRSFVEATPGISLVCPVHPNPHVVRAANQILANTNRIHLIAPLNYPDFLHLLRAAWLILSDSGGLQEEVVTLGKPLIILRENTERPESLETGIARIAPDHTSLREALELALQPDSWINHVAAQRNPFGDGKSAARIVAAISEFYSGAGR